MIRRPLPALLAVLALAVRLEDVAAQAVASTAARAPVTAYEVELTFTGYSGLVEGAPNCQVNQRGYDRLAGIVTGPETPDSGEDVVYAGKLARTTAMDFCETKGKDSPDDDERVWCVVTLTGRAVMDVELTVYGESGRGAYLEARDTGGATTVQVGGSCGQEETDQVRADYPAGDDGGGASPNGQPIADTRAVAPSGSAITFVTGGIARLRPGTYPPDSPQGGWTLRVIRKVP